ncbi:hypothetical protein CAL30_05130 [Megasphaera hutchinsoni]|uniref:Uncharacterized protein n=1 Tax=Megasphaera hutchinsoni TaxID=1588748 RepID=A0A2J8BA32_9FIRM|nr:hypothetical protein [Megasphaera genomosp. type_2]PNH21613.1 hypothetical protein CAL30_05130 [Megasphaera genomosp. type_2]
MTVLDSFIDEMLQTEVPKTVFINTLLRALEVPKKPKFTVPASPYTFESNIHGLRYDYQANEVCLCYKVVPSIYADMVISFRSFKVILEGLGVCIRMQKW